MTGSDSLAAKNFRYHFLEGSLYGAALGLLNSQTVFPALVQRLGGSNLAIGALPVIVYLAYFLPQVFVANVVRRSPFRKPHVLRISLAQRLQILVLGVVVALFGLNHPAIALALVFIVATLNQVLAGFSSPGWFDLVAKTVPPDKRGKLMGSRSSVGAAMGFLNTILLTGVLLYLDFPYNYSVVFLLAFLYQIASWFVLRKVVEENPSEIVAPVSMMNLFKEIREILKKDERYRRFLAASALSTVGLMPMGFFTVAALQKFHLSEAYVGIFTMTAVSSQVLSAGVLGWVSDVKGYKVSLMSCSVAMILATAVALLSQHPVWFYLIFSLVGLIVGTEIMARYNFAADCSPESQRPMYIGLMNAWLAPWYLSNLIGGWLSDAFGYEILFVVGGLFSLAGFFFLLKVRDPRRPRPS